MSNPNPNPDPEPATPPAGLQPGDVLPPPPDPTPSESPKPKETAAYVLSELLSISEPPKKPKKKDPEPPAAEEPAPDPAPTPTTAPAPAPTPAPTPEPAKATLQKRKALTAEEIARIAAEAAAAVSRPTAAPAPAPEAEELPPDIAKKAEIYSELEQLYPEKYKPGLVKRLAEAAKKELAYCEKWEAENPGRAFDATDEEHADWYAKHYPQIDDEDMTEARLTLKARKLVENNPRVRAAEEAAIFAKAAPEAAAIAEAVPAAVMSRFVEGPMDEASFKEWETKNPAHATLFKDAAVSSRTLAHEASLLWDGARRFDEQNPVHQTAAGYLKRFEAELLASGDQFDARGRKWVPLSTYATLPPEAKARCFTIEKQHLAQYMALSEADKAVAMLKRLGLDVSKASPKEAPKAAAAPPLTPSPSVGAGSPTPPKTGVTPNKEEPQPSVLHQLLGIE